MNNSYTDAIPVKDLSTTGRVYIFIKETSQEDRILEFISIWKIIIYSNSKHIDDLRVHTHALFWVEKYID